MFDRTTSIRAGLAALLSLVPSHRIFRSIIPGDRRDLKHTTPSEFDSTRGPTAYTRRGRRFLGIWNSDGIPTFPSRRSYIRR